LITPKLVSGNFKSHVERIYGYRDVSQVGFLFNAKTIVLAFVAVAKWHGSE